MRAFAAAGLALALLLATTVAVGRHPEGRTAGPTLEPPAEPVLALPLGPVGTGVPEGMLEGLADLASRPLPRGVDGPPGATRLVDYTAGMGRILSWEATGAPAAVRDATVARLLGAGWRPSPLPLAPGLDSFEQDRRVLVLGVEEGEDAGTSGISMVLWEEDSYR